MTAATTYNANIHVTQNYFIYRLKKCLIPFGVILAAFTVGYILPLCMPSDSFWYEYYNGATYLEYFAIIACIAMPVFTFNYRMNKRSADLYYALPIRREKLFLSHYITGFIAIIAAYTLVFWTGFIIVACKAPSSFELINQAWMYLVSLPLLYIVYSLYSFIYTRANNVLDGLLFMLFFTFALMLLSTFIVRITASTGTEYYYDDYNQLHSYSYRVYCVYPEYYLPFAPFSSIYELFEIRTAGYASSLFSTPFDYASINLTVSLSIHIVLSAAATLGMIYCEKRSKAENCEQISDSWFGYRTMIPLYAASLCFYITRYTGGVWVYTLAALIIVISYFITAVYKRSLKIGWKASVVLACSLAAGLAIGILVRAVM